jgi:hypothetical protein
MTKFTGVYGDTATILMTMFGPPQHDSHVRVRRWSLQLQEADRRSAAVAKEADRIIAKYQRRTK